MPKGLHFVPIVIIVFLLAASLPATAQESCGDAPPPRLIIGQGGQVTFTNGLPLNVRETASLSAARTNQIPEGTFFVVLEGPVCADNIYWWRIRAGAVAGWAAEGVSGEYYVEPALTPTPTAPPPSPAATGAASSVFVTWDWVAFAEGYDRAPDPMTITPPPVYAGDLPALPVDLSDARFLDDANLNADQRALLAQNGFVVVPAGLEQFSDVYSWDETWLPLPEDFDPSADPATQDIGHAYFVTSDAMLHALHYIFDNLLTDLEKVALHREMTDTVVATLQAAHEQAQRAVDTPLAVPAHHAELFLAVALELLSPGQMARMVSGEVASEAQDIVALALAGEGQLPLPFLENYREDFSQYRPRGHYDGDDTLERYFRGVMWLGRITFRARSESETLTALLLLRALRNGPEAYESWGVVHDALSFLIGPVDDLGPPEYGPLADEIFGSDLSLASLTDAARLATFRERIRQLPGPRVNGIVLPADTQAQDIADLTRGFRFFGQRFTFDGYVMQQLMHPYVVQRFLPTALDVPAAVGSDTAYALAREAGASQFPDYDPQMTALRGELGALTDANWRENIYGGWLWTLEPLWVRDPAPYPPLMLTEAWLRRDLQTGLASWTELKHDTVLYIKQPGGMGGGGAPLTSFGYVEPNPLVFARLAVVAAMTYQGLQNSPLTEPPPMLGYNEPGLVARAPGLMAPYADAASQFEYEGLMTDLHELRFLALRAAEFAEIARRELAGEPLTEDHYWSIYGFGTYLYQVLYSLHDGQGPPDPVALVTDVANNPDLGAVLQEGVGNVDMIYVAVPTPRGGLQIVRGGVFSYYEFVGDINARMTDDEWRALVAGGDLPPRPEWVSAFYSE